MGSMQAMSPSGATAPPQQQMSPSPDSAADSGKAVQTSPPTILVVGTSVDANVVPYWDVHCSGPYAHWALRTFVGVSAGLGFCASGFQRSKASSSVAGAWPLSMPLWTVSMGAAHESSMFGGGERPPPAVLFSF